MDARYDSERDRALNALSEGTLDADVAAVHAVLYVGDQLRRIGDALDELAPRHGSTPETATRAVRVAP